MTMPAWLSPTADLVRRRAADLIARHDLPGAVVGLVAGRDLDTALVWSQGFAQGGGPARPDPATGRAHDADTVFRVASITKTFTATALVQLRDEGKLRLDDPLAKHLPEFAAVENPFGPIEDVTLRRVASHSSGLPGEPPTDHWVSLRFPTREEWLATIPQVKVAIPPGSAFKYSNLGYTLLGEVVERLSGLPYAEYVRQAILGPLGLASSAFELSDELRPRAARGHMPHPFEDEAQPAPPSPLNGMAAAGQLWTSARDLARWIALHLRTDAPARGGTQILAGASLAEMQRASYVEPSWSGGYGFGWRIIRQGERVYHGHGGSVPGFRSQVLFDAALGVGLIVLIDGMGPVDEVALSLMNVVTREVQAAEPDRPAEPPAPTPDAYRPLLGMYRMVHFGDIGQVEWRGGKLVLKGAPAWQFPGAPPIVLEPTGDPHAFLVRGGRYSGELLTFGIADGGAVLGFSAAGFRFSRLAPATADDRAAIQGRVAGRRLGDPL